MTDAELERAREALADAPEILHALADSPGAAAPPPHTCRRWAIALALIVRDDPPDREAIERRNRAIDLIAANQHTHRTEPGAYPFACVSKSVALSAIGIAQGRP